MHCRWTEGQRPGCQRSAHSVSCGSAGHVRISAGGAVPVRFIRRKVFRKSAAPPALRDLFPPITHSSRCGLTFSNRASGPYFMIPIESAFAGQALAFRSLHLGHRGAPGPPSFHSLAVQAPSGISLRRVAFSTGASLPGQQTRDLALQHDLRRMERVSRRAVRVPR